MDAERKPAPAPGGEAVEALLVWRDKRLPVYGPQQIGYLEDTEVTPEAAREFHAIVARLRALAAPQVDVEALAIKLHDSMFDDHGDFIEPYKTRVASLAAVLRAALARKEAPRG